MSLKELLKKAQNHVEHLKSVTEGFPHPTEDATGMLPANRKTAPKKHIRADTQTEVNFKKESDLKKSSGDKPKWRVKLHGKNGYHHVVDIHPAVDKDEELYDLGKAGVVRKSEIEEFQKAIPLAEYHHDEDYLNQDDSFSGIAHDKGYEHQKTNRMAPGLFHHVFKDSDGKNDTWHHVISKHEDPRRKGIAELVAQSSIGSDNTPNVLYSAVDRDHEGKGLGKKAYIQAIKFHGSLQTDKDDPKTKNAWNALSQYFGKQNETTSENLRGVRKINYDPVKPSKVKSAMAQVFGKAYEVEGEDELEKGEKGDWTKEGYTIDHVQSPNGGITVKAFHPSVPDRSIGEVYIPKKNQGRRYIQSISTFVEPEHRRKGLATAMYQHAENVTGKKIKPSKDRTDDGKKLWRYGQKQWGSTKFGKSNQLSKSLPEGKIYIAMDGDNAGSQVERAALRDDVKAIADISNRIKAGSQAVIDMAKQIDPEMSVVVHGGDDLGFLMSNSIQSEHVEMLRYQYKKVAGFTITAGIGHTIPEATHAMLWGKVTGKDKTVTWDEQIERELSFLKEEETPEEKVKGILS